MKKRHLDALTLSNTNADRKNTHKYDIVVQTIFTILTKDKRWMGQQDSKVRISTPKTAAIPECLCLFF